MLDIFLDSQCILIVTHINLNLKFMNIWSSAGSYLNKINYLINKDLSISKITILET